MYDWGNRRLQAQFDTIGRADRLDLDSSFQRLTLLDVCSVGRLRVKGEELRVGIMSPLAPELLAFKRTLICDVQGHLRTRALQQHVHGPTARAGEMVSKRCAS